MCPRSFPLKTVRRWQSARHRGHYRRAAQNHVGVRAFGQMILRKGREDNHRLKFFSPPLSQTLSPPSFPSHPSPNQDTPSRLFTASRSVRDCAGVASISMPIVALVSMPIASRQTALLRSASQEQVQSVISITSSFVMTLLPIQNGASLGSTICSDGLLRIALTAASLLW